MLNIIATRMDDKMRVQMVGILSNAKEEKRFKAFCKGQLVYWLYDKNTKKGYAEKNLYINDIWCKKLYCVRGCRIKPMPLP